MKRIHNGLDKRLRWLRSKFYTQLDFEYASGCNHMVMSRYINRETEPLFTSLVRICTRLNLSADWLLLGQNEYAPKLTDREWFQSANYWRDKRWDRMP